MANFYETVLTVLKSDERFVAEDGTFLRNAVYEAAMKMDQRLIHLLLSNEETSTRFFADVDGVKVFDKIGFAWVINNRQFLPDSYTRFKNKIGLADENGDLISTSGKVELVFPYKDCVLEGGQTMEDQKRQEVFYNQLLAPDDVDRLLFPKVLSNAVRYSKDDQSPTTEFLSTDNIVIKGNNLLSLATLMRNYEGMVKCIYIDMIITGERRDEGGMRSVPRKDNTSLCFTETASGQYRLRPLYYVSDDDKAWYKSYYGIRYSDAYEVYGLKRTGCCGCPISYRAVDDLEIIREYEPNVVKAAWNIFGKSYEYRQKYNAYKADRLRAEKDCANSNVEGQMTMEELIAEGSDEA